MNEKRPLSTLDQEVQEENSSKKKKIEIITDESSSDDNPLGSNELYQELEQNYTQLSESLISVKKNNLNDREIQKFFVDVIENRCLVADLASDINNHNFAAIYYEKALDIYEEWDCYGTPSDDNKIIMGEKYHEDDIKRRINIFHKLYVIKNEAEDDESLCRAFKVIQMAIAYLAWLCDQNTSNRVEYEQKLKEYNSESKAVMNKLRTYSSKQNLKLTQEKSVVANTVVGNKSEDSSKFDYQSHVVDEIKSSSGSDKILIHSTSLQQQDLIYNWLQNHDILKILGRFKFFKTPEGILINEPKSISKIKAWQVMSDSLDQAYNEKNWRKFFNIIDALKFDNKIVGIGSRLKLVKIYYKKFLTRVPVEEKDNFTKAYHETGAGRKRVSVKDVENTTQQNVDTQVISNKTIIPVENAPDFMKKSLQLSPTTTFSVMQNPRIATFFNQNYENRIPKSIENLGTSNFVDLSKSAALPSIPDKRMPVDNKSANPILNAQARSFLNKEQLERESLEKLKLIREEMINLSRVKLMEEAKTVLAEIHSIQSELKIPNDTPIIEENLSIDSLKQKIPILKNKLEELKESYRSKVIEDILLLDKELTSINSEQSGLSLGK